MNQEYVDSLSEYLFLKQVTMICTLYFLKTCLLFCPFYVDTGRMIVVIMFQALRNRARKAKAARKPHVPDIKPGSVIENIAQTQRLAETALGPTLVAPSSGMEEERPTNTGSGSQVMNRQVP
jgi:hypothetical protein